MQLKCRNLMKKIIPIVVAITILIYPSISLASYLIELKNEERFLTNHYWEEGKEIVFYYYGGIVRIKRDLVHKIKDSDLDSIFKQPQPEKIEKAPESARAKSESEKKKEIQPPSSPEKDVFLDQRDALLEEIKTVSDAYRKAKQNRDRQQMQKLRKNLLSLQTDLSKLRKKAKAANGGRVPSWFDKTE